METIQQDVAETAAEQQENFRKLSERQTKSVNEIYSKYQDNKIKLSFSFSYLGGFLGSEKKENFSMDSIIMVDGSFAYTLVHAKESPFRLHPQTRKLISVSVRSQARSSRLRSKLRRSHLWTIPRILIVPLVNPVDLRKSSSIELFQSPGNPYLFSEAVVVDAKEQRFGQTDFVRDERDARYIKVRHTRFAFVTGAFDRARETWSFPRRARCSESWSTGLRLSRQELGRPGSTVVRGRPWGNLRRVQDQPAHRLPEEKIIWLE